MAINSRIWKRSCMSKDEGPWGQSNSKPAAPSRLGDRGRLILVLGIFLGGLALLVGLARAFPGAVQGNGWGYVFYLLVILAAGAVRILQAGPLNWRQGLSHFTSWLTIVGVLVLGVTYQAEILAVLRRVGSTVSGGYPVSLSKGESVISRGAGGVFEVVGMANGKPVRFMVDTGASETVLSPEDAQRLGVDLSSLKFDIPSETANGIGYGARYELDRLSIGDIAFDKVPVMVNQAPMSSSLLGQTFLKRLKSVEVKGDKLYLRAAD